MGRMMLSFLARELFGIALAHNRRSRSRWSKRTITPDLRAPTLSPVQRRALDERNVQRQLPSEAPDPDPLVEEPFGHQNRHLQRLVSTTSLPLLNPGELPRRRDKVLPVGILRMRLPGWLLPSTSEQRAHNPAKTLHPFRGQQPDPPQQRRCLVRPPFETM
jgi:hypothetical protein